MASTTDRGWMVPSPLTSAWSRTRRRSRFTMRGVPRPRMAMSRADSASTSTPRIPAERRTMAVSSSSP